MRLEGLEIHDLRIIEAARLEPAPGLNLIVGGNGAGKTSVLEAIHLLATGRTFRKGEPRAVVRTGSAGVVVHGRVRALAGVHRLGVSRGTQGLTARLDGQDVRGMAPLAQLLPVLVIDPGGDDPVEGAPGARRALLDWGVFYADSGYRSAWARFQRALRQRNEALRRGGRALGAWTEEFVRLGEAVHAQRAAYAARLDTAFRTMMAEAVADAEAADRERGFSGVGPQRADLVVRLGDVGAAGRVSRGQGKVLKAGLRLAQNLLLKEDQETGAVVLLDDLGSELDPMRQAWVVSRLIESNSQVIATAIDGGSGFGDWAPARMFHVEHGRLRPTEQV